MKPTIPELLDEFGFSVACAVFSFAPPTSADCAPTADSFQVRKCWGNLDETYPWMSVTKLLTSRTIIAAVENGVFELDQSQLRVGEGELPAEVTIRQLLAHASGISANRLEFNVSSETKRIYSNTGYEVLAEILGNISGIPFAQWLKSMVLDPLDMQAQLQDSPAWGITGSLRDLLKFAQEAACPRFLSIPSHQLWHQPAFDGIPGILPGYGWQKNNLWGLGAENKGDKLPHWSAPGSSPQTYGHFGQSGSFLWVDPVNGNGAVFLGAKSFGEPHRRLWPKLNQALIDCLG